MTQDAYRQVLEALTEATGMEWNPPPEIPSVLHNGYQTELNRLEAPLIVRRLKQLAMETTGRNRAIIFAPSSPSRAVINIPREVAEHTAFLSALHDHKDGSSSDLH